MWWQGKSGGHRVVQQVAVVAWITVSVVEVKVMGIPAVEEVLEKAARGRRQV